MQRKLTQDTADRSYRPFFHDRSIRQQQTSFALYRCIQLAFTFSNERNASYGFAPSPVFAPAHMLNLFPGPEVEQADFLILCGCCDHAQGWRNIEAEVIPSAVPIRGITDVRSCCRDLAIYLRRDCSGAIAKVVCM